MKLARIIAPAILAVGLMLTGNWLRADTARALGFSRQYVGVFKAQADSAKNCTFNVVVDEIEFQLNSVREYKLVRIGFQNSLEQSITLSAKADVVDAQVGQTTVTGLLNLQNDNPAFWDSLDDGTRKMLAYPEVIEPSDSSDKHGYLYVWFPSDKMSEMPSAFHFKIDGVSSVIELRVPPPRKD